MILSKYDSDVDIYRQYEFSGDNVTFERGYKQAQTKKPLTNWTQRVDEIGWRNKENYIKFLKTNGFREETSDDVRSKRRQAYRSRSNKPAYQQTV